MKKLEHLTQIEIFGYHNDKLSAPETHRIGRHLLICKICRESIPAPTIDQLKAAIFIDNNTGLIETKSTNENSESFIIPSISRILSFLKRPIDQTALTFASVAFVILIGSLFAFWLTSRQNENTIAKLTEIEIPAAVLGKSSPTLVDLKQNDAKSAPANSENNRSPEKSLKIKPEKPKIESTAQKQADKRIANETFSKRIAASTNIADVRGKLRKCNEESLFESEFTFKDSKIVFTWKRIPKAKAYHLYISDDNEILIDEFETETETSFITKKLLDPLKSYKWKIIATLENGQIIVGPSLKVTSKELQKNRMKLEKSKMAQIRCSENG
jgi:hypothetical protein